MFQSAVILFLEDILSIDKKGALKFHPQTPGHLRDISAIRGRIFAFISSESGFSQMKIHPLLREAHFPDLIYFHLGDAQKIWELRRRYALDFKKCTLVGKLSREGFAREFSMRFEEIDRVIQTPN